ncbi:hypothetical protein [Nevskia sp.]|uniref:hypothetical protein n=1 Tax=Nevskia sp. TaxID=1929292 RepID=UPI003F71AC90
MTRGSLGLFPLSIAGEQTPLVQSLTSYLCSLASAHNRSPTAMLGILGRHTGTPLETMAVHLTGTDGSIISGYGVQQNYVLTALSRASGRSDLIQMCMGQFRPVFAPKGGRAVKVNRHWCAQCYREMRLSGVDAYDILLVQLPDLQICPKHLVELHSKCGNCDAYQLTLPANCKMDTCGECGAWLGSFDAVQLNTDLESAAYQKWLINELSELLIVRDRVAPLLSGREISRFLRELVDVRQLTQRQIAVKVNIPVNTLQQWIHFRNKPTIMSWLRACANLGISPASVFLDPDLAAHQLPLPFASPTIYKRTRDAPFKHYSRELIQEAVAHQLSLTQPPFIGTKELALKLDIPVGILYFYDPHGCKLLTKRLRRHRALKREYKKASFTRSARRVLTRMNSEGRLLTRRVFIDRFMAKTKCSLRAAKQIYPDALRKFLNRGAQDAKGE